MPTIRKEKTYPMKRLFSKKKRVSRKLRLSRIVSQILQKFHNTIFYINKLVGTPMLYLYCERKKE
jgi:hypothetical protein